MSGRITAASAKRMEARDRFVDVTPVGYLTIEDVKTGLPVLDVRLTGHPVAGPPLGHLLAAALETLFVRSDDYRVKTRRTA